MARPRGLARRDFLIVGAGFAGSVCAERLAAHGNSVLLIDRRPHIGGNAHDCLDEHGVLVHPYGPHIFHTNASRIVDYLSRFTAWRPYEHRVLAHVDGKVYPIPINRTTINALYGLDLDADGAAAHLERVRLPRAPLTTAEDVVLDSVGADLCDKFFRGYTRKQWGLDLSEVSAGVTARIPTRCNDDDRYFSDRFQCMPADGYTKMFERMVASPHIEVRLGVDFEEVRGSERFGHTIFTGPIDAYFGYCLGRLPYRSLRFEHEHLPATKQFQPVAQVNYPNDHAFTRITEFRHLTAQAHSGTSIAREYPQADGDPFYPIPRPENEALFRRYEALSREEPATTFVGRLARYRYYNMDQVVGAALAAVDRLLSRRAA